MIGRTAIFMLAMASAALPVQADHDRNPGAWGSLLPAEPHAAEGGAPMWAPPVVVAPLFGAAPPRRLPNLCLQAVDTPDGWQRFYDTPCLVQHDRARHLPRDCRVRLTTWGAVRQGYDAQCLFDAGFLRED